jgi:hypothetical protein
MASISLKESLLGGLTSHQMQLYPRPSVPPGSAYVGLDGQLQAGGANISCFPPGARAWRDELVETGQPATFVVDTPGIYVLNLWVREDGFILDQVVLTPDEGFVPGE